jgi:hypothetical protein
MLTVQRRASLISTERCMLRRPLDWIQAWRSLWSVRRQALRLVWFLGRRRSQAGSALASTTSHDTTKQITRAVTDSRWRRMGGAMRLGALARRTSTCLKFALQARYVLVISAEEKLVLHRYRESCAWLFRIGEMDRVGILTVVHWDEARKPDVLLLSLLMLLFETINFVSYHVHFLDLTRDCP